MNTNLTGFLRDLPFVTPLSTMLWSHAVVYPERSAIAQMYHQWQIQGRGPSWGPKGRKKRPGVPLSQGLGDRAPPPPYLKVWIHHWSWLLYSDTLTFDFSQGQYVTKNQPMADPCLVEWRAEKKDPAPPYLRDWVTGPPPPPLSEGLDPPLIMIVIQWYTYIWF